MQLQAFGFANRHSTHAPQWQQQSWVGVERNPPAKENLQILQNTSDSTHSETSFTSCG